jgi:hypothetical protein
VRFNVRFVEMIFQQFKVLDSFITLEVKQNDKTSYIPTNTGDESVRFSIKLYIVAISHPLGTYFLNPFFGNFIILYLWTC